MNGEMEKVRGDVQQCLTKPPPSAGAVLVVRPVHGLRPGRETAAARAAVARRRVSFIVIANMESKVLVLR